MGVIQTKLPSESGSPLISLSINSSGSSFNGVFHPTAPYIRSDPSHPPLRFLHANGRLAPIPRHNITYPRLRNLRTNDLHS